jgi:hypothetical protein
LEKATTASEAQDEFRTLLVERDENRLRPIGLSPLFKDYAQIYLDSQSTSGKKADTLVTERGHINRWIEAIGHLRLDDPIIKLHRVGFVVVHHTPKMNNRDTSGYGGHDYQYFAAGDARVANWPRAVLQIEPVAKAVYRFRISKRWQGIGWTRDGATNERTLFPPHSKRSPLD